MSKQADQPIAPPAHLPAVERIQQELATAQSVDNFFGKEGIFAPSRILQNIRRACRRSHANPKNHLHLLLANHHALD